MLLGIGILVAGFVAAVRVILVLHAGWSRTFASLTAFAICPLLLTAYAYTLDSISAGLTLMIGLPVAILAGLAGLAVVLARDLLFWTGGEADSDGDEN